MPYTLTLTVTPPLDGAPTTTAHTWSEEGVEAFAAACRTMMFGATYAAQTINDTIPDPCREWAYLDELTPSDQ